MISRIFIFLVIIFLCHPAYATILLDRVIAVVNKEVITWSELYKMMEYEAEDRIKELTEEERMKLFKEYEALFLEQLIDLKLQIQEAKRLGYGVTPEEINEAIENIKNKYLLTDSAFEESLKNEGLTFEEYKERLSEQILLSKFINRQIRSKIIISDEEIKKYIETNKENIDGDEAFRIRLIFFKKPENEEDKRKIEEKTHLIIQKLKEGEDFSILAREYSEDTSAKIGGDLGFVKRNLIAKEFIDVLSRMKKGDFSEPFWTENGLHIIKLEEKVSGQKVEEIEENMREQVVEAKFLNKYKDYIRGLREKARIEIRL
jgi:peptidyl-prolyl cis-trans isomerase SurA